MASETELIDVEEQDLYEHLRIVVDKGQSLLRIDKFLMHRIENASRNRIQNAMLVTSSRLYGEELSSSFSSFPFSFKFAHTKTDTRSKATSFNLRNFGSENLDHLWPSSFAIVLFGIDGKVCQVRILPLFSCS